MKRYETPSVEVTKFEIEELIMSGVIDIVDGEEEDKGFGELL